MFTNGNTHDGKKDKKDFFQSKIIFFLEYLDASKTFMRSDVMTRYVFKSLPHIDQVILL